MLTKLNTGLKRVLLLLLVVGLTILGVRAYELRSFPALELWHTYVPQELSVAELEQSDWNGFLQSETQIFQDVRREVTDKLPAAAQTPFNRYYAKAGIYPASFSSDWNRSYVLEPTGKPQGAVVLLHGLTDSPYSLRHIARRYVENGFVVVAIRLPGHGTVPAGLTNVRWEDWVAATRLAVREAKRRVPTGPLHLVGFSNGGALAVKYAADALENPQLARPDRLVLLSPMIGVTRFARFAGIAGLPAVLPSFAKAAWLSVVPEFNPFKYNSFPVNGARQSYRLTDALQEQIARLAQNNGLQKIAPIMTFQSVLDFTVSTPAILSGLYAHLPENGSELMLFDVNRSLNFNPLLRPSSETALARMLPTTPQRYQISVIGNDPAVKGSLNTVARTFAAGTTTATQRALDTPYPAEIFSLSHVAVPFPMDDALYGLNPVKDEYFGIHIGTLAPRGERGALIVSMDFISRISANPFYPLMMERIEAGIKQPTGVLKSSKIAAPSTTPALIEGDFHEENTESHVNP
ncbi:alpha/beta hydrolase [Deefgea rivuli]|uniref:alpha/beta hydrolase n=1 Tax=Deefgea rivuli TaxID=400948 RepID=UPI0004821E04|nr:alpha/beta hydrolase [Deefgea rivuli]